MDPEELAAKLAAETERAAKAEGDLRVATARAEELTEKLAAAETRAEAADKLAGEMLADISTEVLADVTRLSESTTMAGMVTQLCVERRDYAQLKKLRDEKRAEVAQKIPVGRRGYAGVGQPAADDEVPLTGADQAVIADEARRKRIPVAEAQAAFVAARKMQIEQGRYRA